MKLQALFSSKDAGKKIKCHLLQFCLGQIGLWANFANPDQTAPKEWSGQGLHCLSFYLLICTSWKRDFFNCKPSPIAHSLSLLPNPSSRYDWNIVEKGVTATPPSIHPSIHPLWSITKLFHFYTPVWKTVVLCYTPRRPSVCLSKPTQGYILGRVLVEYLQFIPYRWP